MSERKVQPQIGEARTKLVVMKFGGTSVEDAKAMLRTAEIVRGRRERGLSPMVVVSAMANVTDQLLAAAAAAGHGDKAGALAIAARLRNRHLDTGSRRRDGAGAARRDDAAGPRRWPLGVGEDDQQRRLGRRRITRGHQLARRATGPRRPQGV